MERTLGGERLGGGKKMKVYMRNYERSTHELSRAWRSSMSAGTLVPFLKEVALPGDTFDIDLNLDIKTLPTQGPLFGTYQAQLDLFQVPMRLYEAKLHMNMLEIGLKMETVVLPAIELWGINPSVIDGDIDNVQVSSSCIMKYLGVAGLGQNVGNNFVVRKFNAIPYLAYWDIYKNYYANKMEGTGRVIHKSATEAEVTLVSAILYGGAPSPQPLDIIAPYTPVTISVPEAGFYMVITLSAVSTQIPLENFEFGIESSFPGGGTMWRKITNLFSNWTFDEANDRIIGTNYVWTGAPPLSDLEIVGFRYNDEFILKDGEPQIESFPLTNIDDMRLRILRAEAPVVLDSESTIAAPYSFILDRHEDEAVPENSRFSIQYAQEGLALRTYKSDLFNNWLDSEFIDGVDGISEISKVSTVGNSFTIDELNLSKKIYDMLNRIVVSGGSYDDWLDATYTEDRTRSAESPMYMGGLIQDIVFEEVISTARTEETPLGQLAGRGRNGQFQKGGKVIIKVDEPSYIIGIVSIVPNIDYSQGNDWDTNLKTMNDLHKPALDEIGFQDLITDQMAYWDTNNTDPDDPTFKSAGKQPAWINYMTAVNKVYGTFAEQNNQMFMVLNRRYEPLFNIEGVPTTIRDLTTYVDPSKFNHIFADARLDAQNFWVQIGIGIEARRKMSAKIIPNL